MKKIIYSIGILLSVVSFKSYSQQTKTVGDDDQRYTIEVPSSWKRTVNDTKMGGTLLVSVVYLNDSINNTGEQLVIIYGKNANSLKDAYKDNKKGQSKLDGFKLIQEGDNEINGVPSKWFMYNMTEKGILLKGKYYTLVKSGYCFQVFYILPDNRFDAVKDNFEKIISTLKLSKLM